jgi:5,10-methylenetetrahydrofolate reductase
MTAIYKYIGDGGALYHVPARDLTADDIAERAEVWRENGITEAVLLGSGLYQKIEAPKETKRVKKEGE